MGILNKILTTKKKIEVMSILDQVLQGFLKNKPPTDYNKNDNTYIPLYYNELLR